MTIVNARELLKDKPHVQEPSFLSNGYSMNFFSLSPTNQMGTFSGCCSALNNIEIVNSLCNDALISLFVGNFKNTFLYFLF